MLKADEFRRLSDIPPEVEWFADIQNLNTREAYRRDLGQFMAFLGINEPGQFREVARAHIIAWRKSLEKEKLSAASIRRKLAALSSLFTYLCERNAVASNPTLGVSRPKEGSNEGKTPALSDDQARSLLEAPPADTWQGKRDRAMLAVLLYHGLRASELCALTVGDYGERRGIKTLIVHGKGEKIRYLPVHPKAIAALADYLGASAHAQGGDAGVPLFIPAPAQVGGQVKLMARYNITYLLERYAPKLGIPARPHALRATAATNALENGADFGKVQTWLGHANPMTTKLYDKRKDRPEESPTFKVEY